MINLIESIILLILKKQDTNAILQLKFKENSGDH